MGPKIISAREVLADIGSGLSNREIAEKYELSPQGMRVLFDKLLSANLVTGEEHRRRVGSETPAMDRADGMVGDTVPKPMTRSHQENRPAGAQVGDSALAGGGAVLHAASEGGTRPVEPAVPPEPGGHAAHERSLASNVFLDSAKQGRNQWWCYLASILMIVILSTIMGTVFMSLWVPTKHDGAAAASAAINPFDEYIVTNAAYCFILICLFLAVRYEHKRPFLSLISPNSSMNLKRAGKSFVLFTGLIASTTLIGVVINHLIPGGDTLKYTAHPTSAYFVV